ncbi:MAG: hypothetical protein JWQ40_3220 [Segetibacter sp.]|nr:hypothetical protein [Segetibacter sp.]
MKAFAILLFFIASGAKAQIKNDCFKNCGRRLAGAATNAASFYQNSKMNYYDIKHLKIDITVQPKSNFITSSCSYKVSVLQALDTFAIEFKQSMTLDSVYLNNVKALFTRSNHHIYIPLSPASPAGSLLDLTFYYKGNVAAGFFTGTDENGLDFTASVSESFQAREWFPAKQLLNEKIDSTDIWITTAAAYKAGSNGLLKAVVDLPGNQKQYRWACRYPLNYYMPSIAVGNYLEYNNYAKPSAIAPDSILVQNLLVNNNTYFNAVKVLVDKTPPFLEKMSELFGLYPFYKEKYGHSQADIGGGMEHATMTTLKNFEETLVAHELAHQWFGDNVTCASWNDIWVNESFATYSSLLMQEKLPALFPTNTATAKNELDKISMAEPWGSVYVPSADTYNEGRIFNYRLSYAKGATALHNLRFEMQSDTVFFNILKRYQQQFKNSFASTTDFKQLAEQVSGKNLSDFFSQKIYGEGYPTYNVSYWKHGADTMVLDISQTTSMPNVTPLFTGLMEYKILSPNGDTTIKLNQTSNNQRFTLYYPRIPTGVEVDPNNWVLNKVGTITEGVSTQPIPVNVTISPNPVYNNFTVTMPPNVYSALRVIDVNGRVLANYSIPTSGTSFRSPLHLPSGVYFFNLVGNKENVVRKILVDRR